MEFEIKVPALKAPLDSGLSTASILDETTSCSHSTVRADRASWFDLKKRPKPDRCCCRVKKRPKPGRCCCKAKKVPLSVQEVISSQVLNPMSSLPQLARASHTNFVPRAASAQVQFHPLQDVTQRWAGHKPLEVREDVADVVIELVKGGDAHARPQQSADDVAGLVVKPIH